MRKIVISGNWKMNKNKNETLMFLDKIKTTDIPTTISTIIFPPSIHIPLLENNLKQTNIEYGTQNVYFEHKGAFTGELSIDMIKSYNCKHVLVGHSERRTLFHETNELLNKKIHTSLTENIITTYCIGETLEERDANQTFKVLKKQLQEGLYKLNNLINKDNLIIAYEPVWAIGTGKVASPEQAQEAHKFIRSVLSEQLGQQLANAISIQYGGSVKSENIESLISLPDIDGALIGGACLEAESFLEIIKKTSRMATNETHS